MEWRDIRRFEGRYQVSDEGRVRSLLVGRELALGLSNSRYPCVSLRAADSRASGHFVHRLVAEAFLPEFSTLLQVNHKDGDRTNNRLANLEMVTASENMRHSVRVLGRIPPSFSGADNGWSRPVERLSREGALVARYAAAKDAVREGFNGSCICECCRGIQKTHGGYRWRYAEAVC